NVTLGEFPTDPEALARTEVQKEQIGVQLQDLTPDIGSFLGLPPGTKGAVVTEVVPGSRAAKAGLQADDVILEVNRKAVTSGPEVAAALKANTGGPQVMRVRRGGATRLVTIPAP